MAMKIEEFMAGKCYRIMKNNCCTHAVKTKLPNELGLYDMSIASKERERNDKKAKEKEEYERKKEADKTNRDWRIDDEERKRKYSLDDEERKRKYTIEDEERTQKPKGEEHK
jgi:hypothetical protein